MSIDWRKSTKPNERGTLCEICKTNIRIGEPNYCWSPNPQGPGYIRAHTACVEQQDPGARSTGEVLDNILDEMMMIRELFERLVKAVETQNPPEVHP